MPQLHGGLMGDAGGYQITNSVRLRAAASAYFSRTFGSPTTQDTFTFSAWVKRSKLSSLQNLLGVSTNTSIGFPAADTLVVTIAGSATITTSGLYRDPSAWCHVQYKQTTGAATLYFNGTSVGTSATVSAVFNTAVAHQLGAANTSNYTDGYLSDVYFIDGQALSPSSFGETDSNGVWVPKAYTGTYGTNGFHLDFKDAAVTAGSNAGLGKDVSGNGNYWTTNNISVTAGTAYDSFIDTPTNNFCTLNPLKQASSITLTEANLRVSCSAASARIHSTVLITDPTYFEVNWVSGGRPCPGVATPQGDNGTMTGDATADATLWEFFAYNGNKMNGSNAAYGSAAVAGDLIGVAVNPFTGKIWWSINGTWQASGDPAADTNAAFTNIPSTGVVPCIGSQQSGWDCTINFGQAPLRVSATWHEAAGGYFRYTPPTGFKALCTANLPNGSVTTSGSFTGTLAADGPFVWLNGCPTAMTINGNAVTFGTHADKTAGGFKLRTASASYNNTGSNTYSVSTNAGRFNIPQTAQGNP
jgi:hypothetical protein